MGMRTVIKTDRHPPFDRYMESRTNVRLFGAGQEIFATIKREVE